MRQMGSWRGAVTALGCFGLALGLLGVVSLTGRSAEGQGAGARPTAVAVVDLGRVLERLDERPEREQELRAEIQRREAEAQTLLDQVQAARDALGAFEGMASNSPQVQEAAERFVELQAELRAKQEIARAVIEQKQKDLELQFFESIRQAVAEYAEREGYDIVMNDDSRRIIPLQLNQQQTQAAIGGRRLLYVADTVDITDEIATFMNNQFNAGGGAAGGE